MTLGGGGSGAELGSMYAPVGVGLPIPEPAMDGGGNTPVLMLFKPAGGELSAFGA